MEAHEYHEEVRRTSSADFPYESVLVLSGLGISGEVGEVLWLLDDILTAEERGVPYPDTSITHWTVYLVKEVGDAMWYITYLLNALDVKLATLMGIEDITAYQHGGVPWSQALGAASKADFQMSVICRRLGAHAGAVADIVKKHVLHGKDLDQEGLLERVNEVFWHLTIILNHFGVEWTHVLDINRDKLRKRYPDGWTREASIARADENNTEDDEVSESQLA